MKFRITKEKFLDGLQQVQNVVSSRATLPILSNVLLEADGPELRMTTTDLDVVVSCRVDAEDVSSPGSTTLPARRLATIVRELPADEILIDVNDDNAARITCGNSFFRILGLSPDDYPPPPRFEDVKEFKVPAFTLRDGLRKVAYAISTDETRYVLNGVYCQFKEGKLGEDQEIKVRRRDERHAQRPRRPPARPRVLRPGLHPPPCHTIGHLICHPAGLLFRPQP